VDRALLCCIMLFLPPSLPLSSSLTHSLPPFLILYHRPSCSSLPHILPPTLFHPVLLTPPFMPSFPPHHSPDAPEAVETLASVHVDAIAQVTRVLRQPKSPTQTRPPPLPHEAAFIVELVKKIYQWGTNVRTMEHLVNMVRTKRYCKMILLIFAHSVMERRDGSVCNIAEG
jgi:hypothetical protein